MTLEKKLGAFTFTADFSLSGDRTGIFGPSGSGKSTLVSMLAGLLRPDSGEITLDGECLFSSKRGIDCRPDQRRIAMVFQEPGLFRHLNVRNNLLYGHKRRPPAERRIDFDALVEVLQLRELLERRVDNLSGGEKQRVAIGRAVLSNPRLLLMDEPLSGLDDPLRLQVMKYLKDVCETFRIPYLFISHSLLEMRIMADNVLVLEKGTMVGHSTSEELARRRLGHSPVGYINLLRLYQPLRVDGLFSYSWEGGRLLVSAGNDQEEALFELSSKDIVLCKKHPQAISARNLLRCAVAGTFSSGNGVGVELACGEGLLVADIVREAADELGIVVGSEIYAAIKATAFRRVG